MVFSEQYNTEMKLGTKHQEMGLFTFYKLQQEQQSSPTQSPCNRPTPIMYRKGHSFKSKTSVPQAEKQPPNSSRHGDFLKSVVRARKQLINPNSNRLHRTLDHDIEQQPSKQVKTQPAQLSLKLMPPQMPSIEYPTSDNFDQKYPVGLFKTTLKHLSPIRGGQFQAPSRANPRHIWFVDKFNSLHRKGSKDQPPSYDSSLKRMLQDAIEGNAKELNYENLVSHIGDGVQFQEMKEVKIQELMKYHNRQRKDHKGEARSKRIKSLEDTKKIIRQPQFKKKSNEGSQLPRMSDKSVRTEQSSPYKVFQDNNSCLFSYYQKYVDSQRPKKPYSYRKSRYELTGFN